MKSPHVRIFRALPIAVAFGLFAGCGLFGSSQPPYPAPAPLPFPHVAIYSGISADGWPLVGTVADQTPDPSDPINQEVITQYARNPMMVLPATPLVDLRPDLLAALRAENPTGLIFAYVQTASTWCPGGGYPAGVFYRHYWEAVEQLDGNDGDVYSDCKASGKGFLWYHGDPAEDTIGPFFVNRAYRVPGHAGTYRYVLAEALAEVVFRDIYQSQKFDGIYLDSFGEDTLWMEPANCFAVPLTDPTGCFDYARAGYNSGTMAQNRVAFAAGWKASHTRYMERLRELIDGDRGANFPVVGNGGQGPLESLPLFNGWMRENFPLQNGGSFFTNLFRFPYGGYLFEDSTFRARQHNFIFSTAPNPGTPLDSENILRMRFGLGSASLGNGWGAFGDASMSPKASPFFQWFYDEYGVDLATGQASSDPAHNGYLGHALTDAYQMISTNPNPELIPVPTFESDFGSYQLVNNNSGVVTTTEFIDAGSPAGGNSLHVTVAGPAGDRSLINVQNKGSAVFPITGYAEYSVTFWLRALNPGMITVALGDRNLSIPVSTAWTRYQARVVPVTTASNGYVRIDLGQAANEFWLDDIHVQQGTSSVYRRDFENGIVLVNANYANQTVTLEQSYRKILGTADPVWNDGSDVTQVTLPGAPVYSGIGSAIFLLK